MNFEPDYIKKLAKILSDNDLTEIMLENGDDAIVLKREKEYAVAAAPEPIQIKQGLKQATTEEVPVAPQEKTRTGKAITSPMVGTFYRSPSESDAPFLNVGDTVSKGQVVCIIEAMKMMNKIESEVSGKITEICVENGMPVEYGQVLMYAE